MIAVFLVTVLNIDSVLGSSNALLAIAIPGVVGLTAVIGLIWGMALRTGNPAAYQFIGSGEQQPLREPTPAFTGVQL
jgi:hypothetical protein